MAENGEEKLIAVARHIAKTLGHNDNMADDILKIFSNFDGRLREKLTEKLADDAGCAVMEQTLNSLDRRISSYVSADHPIWSDPADSSSFLDAIDELISAVRDWNPMANDKFVAACLDRADELVQQVMFRLEEEFRLLMERGGESFDLTGARNDESAHTSYYSGSEDNEEEEDNDDDDDTIPVGHPISDYDIVIDVLPSGTIADLQEIAKRMVAAGFERECSHAYSTCRRDFLEESLSRLGFQRLTIEEVQKMQWTDLEDEIELWIKAINVALRILFPSERSICGRVFCFSTSVSDLSLMEVCRSSTIQLLNFADAVAIGSRAPERLFKVLDVYETMRDVMPEFEAVFSDQSCLFLRNEAVAIWKRLVEAIRGIFMELENLIRRDPAKSAVPGGGLHPITRYVMNYLLAACGSRETLEQVFDESIIPSGGGDYRKQAERSLSSASLSVQMGWIMELLESNLEAKSKIYRDSALCFVFMMNNCRYIVQKVKDSELGSLLGDDWIRKHKSKIRQYHLSYQRSSWSKLLGVLKVDSSNGNSSMGSTNSAPSKALKEKLKLFNKYFEDTCNTQSTWVIFDAQLREELRIYVAEKLLAAYRSFLGRLQAVPDVAKQAERHVKYSVEDIEARINELFSGSASGRS